MFGASTTGTTGINFGASTTPPATGAASSFGKFGASQTSTNTGNFGASTTGGFGATNTGGGFGVSTTGGFGSTNTNPCTGFGVTNTATNPTLGKPQGGFGSFGASTTGTTGTGFGFGASSAPKPSTGGLNFGSSFSTQPSGTSGFGGFGKTNTPNTGFGSFGTGISGSSFAPVNNTNTAIPFGAAPTAVTTPPPIILGADASVAQLNHIKSAYQDPTHSRFKFLMYNTVDPTQRHLYGKPQNISERLWNQAELDNPDPLNCVPVPIIGFKDLLKRLEVQQQYAEKYDQYTEELQGQLKEMEKARRATEVKMEKCRHEHVQLFHQFVKIMKDIEFLQNMGKPLQQNEVNLAHALQKLKTLVNAPDQYVARLNDVVSLEKIPNNAAIDAPDLAPTDAKQVYEFLDQQRLGLEHLTTILTEDLADIKLMKETWRR